MRLKKSIEKAKQQREEAIRKAKGEALLGDKKDVSLSQKEEVPGFEQTAAPAENKTKVSEPGKTEKHLVEDKAKKYEWKSPVYSESKSMELDLKKLAQNRCVCMFPDTPEAENYKILRLDFSSLKGEIITSALRNCKIK